MRFGLDFTSAIPPATLRANGATFVCRYLAPDEQQYAWKKITPAETQQLKAAGIDIVLVWESSAGRALGGNAAGVSDATAANMQTRHLGLDGCPVYFAVDFDAKDYAPHLPDTTENARAKLGPLAAYFSGVHAGLGVRRAGVYGSYYVVKRLLDAGLVTYGWQTSAWSGGQWEPRAHLRQDSNGHNVAGHGVDYDHATASDFGQWKRVAPAPTPTPAPVPAPKPVPAPAPTPKPPHVPAGPVARSPYWKWVAWRDAGSIATERPAVPTKIPVAWAYRYWLHRGMTTPLPRAVKAYLDKHLQAG